MEHTEKVPLRVAILISGRGSNMQSLVQTIHDEGLPVQVCAVISSRADAAGLAWARTQGLNALALLPGEHADRNAYDVALQQKLSELKPDYILLAGFMRVLGAGLVQHFAGRIINIHPSLLPAFPGLHTHAQALAHGVQWHGCTVHFVTPVLDHGPIIAQGVIPVLAGDTPEDLARRLLPLEHQVYGQVLRWLAQGRVFLSDEGQVRVAQTRHRAWVGPLPYKEQETHEQQ